MARGFHEPGDKPRRFYSAVSVAQMNGGFTVMLDGRGLRSPKGAPVVLPTAVLAEQVAEEWAAQGEVLQLADMPVTRLANTALESIPGARDATAQSIADYAASDLLCYYAETPAGLVQRQKASWGPVLDRAQAELGLVFVPVEGVIHRPQPPQTLERVKSLAIALDDFALAGLAFATPLYGSAVLAVAVQRGWLDAEAAYDLSRLDEVWQEEQWGVDAEAAERTDRIRRDARMLGRWFAAMAAAG